VPDVASLITATVHEYDWTAVGVKEIVIAVELVAFTVPLVWLTANTEVHSAGFAEKPVNVKVELPTFRMVSVALFV
jgi:hypothetical protein